MRRAGLTIIAILSAAGSATRISAQAGPVPGGLDTVRFAPELGVDLAASRLTPSGARWRELAPGAGDAAGTVYFGRLRLAMFTPDGAVVGPDSVVTFTVKVGYDILMPGMDEALVGMRAGARRQIVLPLSAQGDAGRSGIQGVPRGTPLVVDVELLRISDRPDPPPGG